MSNNAQLGLGVDVLDMAGSCSEYSHENFPPSLRATATNLVSTEARDTEVKGTEIKKIPRRGKMTTPRPG